MISCAFSPSGYFTAGDSSIFNPPVEETHIQQVQSRDVVESGMMVTVTGNLKKVGGEWYLVVENIMYEILMGREEFVKKVGIPLEEDKEVAINGFFHAEGDELTGTIVPATIELDGEVYRFREDNGTPIWRGQGGGPGGGRGRLQ